MNISFLKDASFKIPITENDHRLDHQLVQKFFALLNKIEPQGVPGKDSVYSVLRKVLVILFPPSLNLKENSIDNFISDYKKDLIYDLGQLRFILVVLAIPQIFEFDFHPPLLGLLKICSILTEPQRQILIKWLSSYTKSQMAPMLEALQNIISIQIVTTNDQAYIKYLLVLSKIFFEANKISKVLSLEDFYIETITQEEDSKEEYAKWLENKLKGTENFTYVDYPWVLEPAFKSYILKEESDYEMTKEIRADLFNNLQGLLGLGGGLDPLLALNNIYFQVKVRRDHLLEDTLNQIVKSNVNPKKPMKVKDEKGE